MRDLYELRPEDIENPPSGWLATLRRIGPGMILAASIVGSGELIATTTLGAETGYAALWIVVFSCLIKPALQYEIGRFSIVSGQTGLAGFNRMPGPRWRVNWVVWMWALVVLFTLFQVGAMFGGVAQVLNQLVPSVEPRVWVLGLLALTLWILLGGGYERIERLATLKVGLFTMLTMLCALLLTRKPELFRMGDVLSKGFTFQLPPGDGLATAIAVFGITGVGATELFMYPYWCVEKGYARFTGKSDGSPAWLLRAEGWIRVMRFDIFASMIIYTIATVAFYLLGAGILHPQGLVPSAKDMIPVLSKIYTETLGAWSLPLFYAGAIFTLYGTIFAATAAHSRLYADMVRLLGGFEHGDYAARLRWRSRFVWLLTTIPAGLFLILESPVQMVKAGGLAQAVLLPVIAVGALFMRYRGLPAEVRSSHLTTAGLWIAAILTVTATTFSLLTFAFR
ncbi:MAG: Nramp family divalent metal transporter [Bryobacteraceae bacterium]|nr:Nramp family divalent metal transporter [Bryobacteraceae bacterium]